MMEPTNNQLTTKEAYQAMFNYLEKLFKMTGSDDLAGFLGSMQLTVDGRTMDPAAWNDWVDAVNQVIKARTM